jgi:hypothetical protein
MAKWSYKVTHHKVNGRAIPESDRYFQCDQSGSCMIHDLAVRGDEIESALNREGGAGWELVQCQYHAGDLLCVWKKEEETE